MKRGDYDHNHTFSTIALVIVTILIVLCSMALGGLMVGLDILSQL